MARRKPAVEPAEPVKAPSSFPPQRSTADIVENGRSWPYGAIPYYVDGLRVSRADYVAHHKEIRRAAALAELDAIADDDQQPTTDPPAEPAAPKEQP